MNTTCLAIRKLSAVRQFSCPRAYQTKKFRLKIRIDIVIDKILLDAETSYAIGNLTLTDRRLP